MGRLNNSITNSAVAIGAQIITMVLQFVLQITFATHLGEKYLGANGLFVNVLGYLALVELGLGFAISFALYKPLANKEYDKVKSILSFYKKMYILIGMVIFASGLIVMQFIPFLIKEGTGIPNVKFMFFLYLVSSVVTYFFAHFQSLIIADQKSYITMINQLIFKVFQSCAQIYVLMNFQSYELYLIIMILCGLGANLNVARIVRNKYPFIIEKSNHKIDKETLVDIKKNVVGTFSGKIGSLVVTSTDNILISKFIGLGMVGLYSNYALITAALTTLLGQAMNSTVASFGNFAVTESKNKQSAMYEVLMCFVSVITISETVAFVLAVQPFITVFFGGDFVLSRTLVCLIAINFGFGSLRSAPLTQISALGVFWHLKYKSIVEAGINLAISLIMIMAFKMGLAGVLIGTICSNVFVNLSWETMVIFRHGFKLSVRRALMKYIGYHALVVGAVLISLKVAASLQVDSVVMIVLLAIAGFTTSLSLLTVAMFNTKEMKFIRDRVLSIVGATS